MWVPRQSSSFGLHPNDPSIYVYRACPKPPPKLRLAELLVTEARNTNKNLGINLDVEHPKLPDTAWMLKALATLAPDHPIFKKDYIYVAPKKDLDLPIEELLMEDGSKFFDDLPLLYKKSDLTGPASASLSKEQRLYLKLAKEQQKQEKAQLRL